MSSAVYTRWSGSIPLCDFNESSGVPMTRVTARPLRLFVSAESFCKDPTKRSDGRDIRNNYVNISIYYTAITDLEVLQPGGGRFFVNKKKMVSIIIFFFL